MDEYPQEQTDYELSLRRVHSRLLVDIQERTCTRGESAHAAWGTHTESLFRRSCGYAEVSARTARVNCLRAHNQLLELLNGRSRCRRRLHVHTVPCVFTFKHRHTEGI